MIKTSTVSDCMCENEFQYCPEGGDLRTDLGRCCAVLSGSAQARPLWVRPAVSDNNNLVVTGVDAHVERRAIAVSRPKPEQHAASGMGTLWARIPTAEATYARMTAKNCIFFLLDAGGVVELSQVWDDRCAGSLSIKPLLLSTHIVLLCVIPSPASRTSMWSRDAYLSLPKKTATPQNGTKLSCDRSHALKSIAVSTLSTDRAGPSRGQTCFSLQCYLGRSLALVCRITIYTRPLGPLAVHSEISTAHENRNNCLSQTRLGNTLRESILTMTSPMTKYTPY